MYRQWNQPPQLQIDDLPTVKPNYSIDLVIDRIHVVAGNVNELTHVVNNHAKEVIQKGEDTLTKFNANYANVSSTVEHLIEVARERTYSIPLSVFGALLICALIWIVLSICYLCVFCTQRCAQRRYLKVKPQII
ncbi:hypothetical protein M3Y94_00114600 [Aphelenchoides besseyi]|nr:hypothetical protein M3Y94_00114600 [Aphelenchoides besseyi]KAI6237470.1 hypothetical protein M3Y95_00268500 [Aphelenchoides besseyi]